MTSKEAFEKMVELCNFYHHTIVKDTDIELICGYPVDNIRRDLEVLEIIKKNPEIVWWCCCYKTAEEMIIDRKGFMLDYSVEEIRKQFNKIKKWLEK